MSLDDCIFLDDTFPALYQPLTLDTFPAEGEEASPGRLSRLYSGLGWTLSVGFDMLPRSRSRQDRTDGWSLQSALASCSGWSAPRRLGAHAGFCRRG